YQDCSNRPLNPEFTLNLPRYAGASVLLARKNFGCGSSREHAVWALCEYGFRAVIAPEFADIFYQNSLKNGLLSIPLAVEEVDELFRLAAGPEPLHLAIDLPAQTVSLPNGSQSFRFKIDPFRKNCLMEGLDDIALTSRHSMEVETFQRRRWAANPWLAKRV
ncbi:MAG: 3-isopropylmalate dehydratase small subunit, partial [Afipia sp.]|nr:3-isopropylmalate dehydratase small subunit [Afipia sp.]